MNARHLVRRTAVKRALAAYIGLSVLLAAHASANAGQGAAPPAGAQLTVTNVWVDVPLSQVCRDISVETGTMIALDATVPDQLISLQADETALDECLRLLAAPQGLAVRRMPQGFYMLASAKPDSPAFGSIADARRLCLKYISQTHFRASLPRSLERYVSAGDRNTEVLVVAPEEAMRAIEDIAALLDVPRRQVMLEAMVLELTEEGSRRFGIDWQIACKNALISLTEGMPAFTGVVRATSVSEREFSSLMITLRLLASQGHATVRSRPRVATLNGEQANIDVSLEEYFNIVTDINGAFLRTELQVVKSGVILEMKPQIGDDGDITVDVSTEVSDVATRKNQVGNGNGEPDELPVVRRRKADTRVRVKEGDAIVIGGLIESQERDVEKRVPVLGSLPVLGALFRSTASATVQKEVVIFITPRVLDGNPAPFADRHEMIDVLPELTSLSATRLQAEAGIRPGA